MKINIVGGRGLMGRIHKPLFEKAGHEVIISGRNSMPSTEEAAENSDITVISVPLEATEETIKKVAPHCKAILDFTSLKEFSIKSMLEHSSKGCEVAGLHPLYGEVSSIEGRTIIYCETERTGEKCQKLVEALKLAGARIVKLSAEQHDKIMAVLQNARTEILESYGLLLKDAKIEIKELYELSPPPTRIMLDLLARQINTDNDLMFRKMRRLNKHENSTNNKLINNLKKVLSNKKNIPEELREMFGEELKNAQKKVEKLI